MLQLYKKMKKALFILSFCFMHAMQPSLQESVLTNSIPFSELIPDIKSMASGTINREINQQTINNWKENIIAVKNQFNITDQKESIKGCFEIEIRQHCQNIKAESVNIPVINHSPYGNHPEALDIPYLEELKEAIVQAFNDALNHYQNN